jgi:hypothetical protein
MLEVKLLNLKQLADAFGVPYQYVKDASTAGLPLIGGRITASSAMAWLEAHPDFRAEARMARAISQKHKRRKSK